MPLESFSELMKIDVTPHCKKRDGDPAVSPDYEEIADEDDLPF